MPKLVLSRRRGFADGCAGLRHCTTDAPASARGLRPLRMLRMSIINMRYSELLKRGQLA